MMFLRVFLPLLEIIVKLAAPVAAFFWAKRGEQLKETKKDAEQAARDATAWANRPHDDDDAVRRLRDLAARKRKDNPKL